MDTFSFPELTCILVSLDPPLPVYLFTVVAGLRDKSFKGYPVKKVSFQILLVVSSVLTDVKYSSFCFCGSRFLHVAVVQGT